MSEVKDILAKNLIKLRTQNKMTQSDLAKKLNYTDKSISKWEHGDATPPLDVLKELSELYGVSVDFLISENADEGYDKTYNNKQNTTNKVIISLLAVSIAWLIATISFSYSSYIGLKHGWLAFIYAVPVSFIILIIFNGIWGKRKYVFILISFLIWTVLTALFLTFSHFNAWSFYILGIPLQIATILWSKLKPSSK